MPDSTTHAPSSHIAPNIFIHKMDSNKNTIWIREMSGSSNGDDEGLAITTDQNGTIYSSGFFMDVIDFNPDASSNYFMAGLSDLYILKWRQPVATKPDFGWSVQTSGAFGLVDGSVITTDQAGNTYATGSFMGLVDFDPGPGAKILSADSAEDFNSGSGVYVYKLNTKNELHWARSFGGPHNDTATAIVTDKDGNVYITGQFRERWISTRGMDIII